MKHWCSPGLCPWHVSLITIFLLPCQSPLPSSLNYCLCVDDFQMWFLARVLWSDSPTVYLASQAGCFRGISNSRHLRLSSFSTSSKLFSLYFSLSLTNPSCCPKTESCFRKWWISSPGGCRGCSYPPGYLDQKLRPQLYKTLIWNTAHDMG